MIIFKWSIIIDKDVSRWSNKTSTLELEPVLTKTNKMITIEWTVIIVTTILIYRLVCLSWEQVFLTEIRNFVNRNKAEKIYEIKNFKKKVN